MAVTSTVYALPGDRSLRRTRRLLLAALDRVSDPRYFTEGAFARDQWGHRLHLERVNDAKATRWSGMGALLHAAYEGWGTETVVEYVPAGQRLDVTGPVYVLAAIALYEEALTDIFLADRPFDPWQPTEPSPERDRIASLFSEERMTASACRFWLAVLVAELPEISRRDVGVAFDIAAQRAQNELDRRKQARGPSEKT